jgi:CRISPR-associated protein Cst2
MESIGELASVAGGHARSFFEMSPRSIVLRMTPSLVAGFNTYGFDETGDFKELARINQNDLPGKEFWIGGELVRNFSDSEKARLTAEGCHLFDNPQQCLKSVADETLKAGVR